MKFTATPTAVAARPGQWCSTSGGGVGTGVGTGVAVAVGAAVGAIVGTVVATGVDVGVTDVDPHPASTTHARSTASDRATPCRAIARRIALVRSDGPPTAVP